MKIVQIVPELRPGSGVEAVAYHLEQEWSRLGVQTERFTLTEAGGGRLPAAAGGLRGKAVLAARVVWFSTVGTVCARRMLARQPEGTVSICHNDALAGTVYVNHGVTAEAMRARGGAILRMLRNPLHLFVWTRDALRFASGAHQLVINLSSAETEALRRNYPRIHPPTEMIGNGVDVDHYRPDPGSRSATRARLGLTDSADVAVFIGHEFGRKGLPQVLEALPKLPNLVLLVVGGTADMVGEVEAQARALDVADRVVLLGRRSDPRPYLHAADVFVLPSAYESYGLVVLEALACGTPVVATAVGCVPEVIEPGINGEVVTADPTSIAAGIRHTLGGDRTAQAKAARQTAEQHTWAKVAQEYLHVFSALEGSRK